MVKQARHMIASGELGPVRKVVVEYPQGWLTEKLEDEGQKQAAWRSDPAKAAKQEHTETLERMPLIWLNMSQVCR